MAFEFLGGQVHCGRPWSPYGVDQGAEGLPGPRGHRRQGRGDGGVPVQQDDPRPGRLADLQGLAGAGVADPRGHLLQVDGALLACRPTAAGEPARREQQAVRALPAQAELLQRHGLDPAAGQADARLRALHRRAARRSRQGLVPHRHEPRPGPARHQRRQAGRGDGHRDLGAVRLHPEARRARTCAARKAIDRPTARRGPQAGRLADGAGQQVRQRPVRRRRRRRLDRLSREQRQHARDRLALADADLPAQRRRGARQGPGQLRPGGLRPTSRRRTPSSVPSRRSPA